jgi:undecaprenyl pyrophosphate phosphatase UppP
MQKEMSSSKHAVNIAFFDVSQMSGATKAFYLLGMLGTLGTVLYYFYNKLVAMPEQAASARQKKIDDKKAKRGKKSN